MRGRLTGLFIGVLAATGSAMSCSSAPASVDVRPNYHADIRPLLQRSCVHCHSPGNLAPFSLATYAAARSLGGSIVKATHDGIMPPWSAVPSDTCRPNLPWRDDESLSKEELDLLDLWVQKGSPEGHATAPETTTPERSTHLDSFDLELTPKSPYVASGDADEYRCFVLDPAITEERYVSAIDLVPGNREIVHHATVLVDRDRTSLQRVGPDGSFECMNDITSGELTQILNWAPGMLPIELPTDVGVKIAPNPLFILLVHYSPKGSTITQDLSKVQVRYAKTRPNYVASTRRFPTEWDCSRGPTTTGRPNSGFQSAQRTMSSGCSPPFPCPATPRCLGWGMHASSTSWGTHISQRRT